ncbi:hypothetical protein STXM2123_3114 [Streptomyces sp. F-3]|uniref:Integral membrane protein n=1 Tax=Streptomyces thermogriseus TaxID=75292 RepID=A0ABP4DGP2_9ACTN|nr:MULTISPECIES: hypothetical protein [unclassified Streptomyces]MDN5384639.1 hypothetical protein [Streptomyces sp. LB8]GAT82413.1 hypothetical protein STXM2123_3114 [Streptomyces sp. F-3]
MLALRLIHLARPAVQLRRLAVAAASAGTGFLLLCCLGYALGHPEQSAAAVRRLSWCVMPLAATVYLAIAVARTDPGTRPRPGLSALGLGPGRLMAVSAATTALSCGFGSLLALLAFLRLRGDLTGRPYQGAGADALAAGHPLPVAGTLTLLAVVPVLASVAVGLVLRPREDRARPPRRSAGGGTADAPAPAHAGRAAHPRVDALARVPAGGPARMSPDAPAQVSSDDPAQVSSDDPAGAPVPAPDGGPASEAADGSDAHPASGREPAHGTAVPQLPPAPGHPPAGLPWGIAVLTVGLTVESYTGRSSASGSALPGGLTADVPVLLGWLLTALGLALAGPGLTHLCGLLLQSVRPGALRLLAGRGLMAEARRIGRPLGVVCAVASGAYSVAASYGETTRPIGPLTVLGMALVAGCAVTVLLTAAVEARQARAVALAALRRLGAPATTLRTAALLRAGALLVLFAPPTLLVAALSVPPLAR